MKNNVTNNIFLMKTNLFQRYKLLYPLLNSVNVGRNTDDAALLKVVISLKKTLVRVINVLKGYCKGAKLTQCYLDFQNFYSPCTID